MSDEGRFVFDTNTLISALLFEQGKPGRAFRVALRSGTILASVSALEELADVLQRKKFNRYVTAEDRDDFLRSLVTEVSLVDPDVSVEECRDPKDNKFLELAVSGGAQYLVTGDKDLLALNPFRDVAIVSPAQFLALVHPPEKPAG